MNHDDAREARLDQAWGPLEPERQRALEAHLARCAECRAFTAEIDGVETGLADTLSSIEPVAASRAFRPRRLARFLVAASLVGAIGLGWWAAQPRVHGAGAVLDRPGIYRLERGEVSLAPATRVVVGAPERLRLESGRAHFRVLEGPPFAVETSVANVEVLGTEFTVELEEDPMNRTGAGVAAASAVVVTVITGVVLVRPNDGQDPAKLVGGQRAVATANAPIRVEDAAEEARQRAETRVRLVALEEALARSEARAESLQHELAAIKQQAAQATGTSKEEGAAPAPAAPPEKSTDEKVREAVAKMDWKSGTRALAAFFKANRTGEPIDPAIYAELSRMNVAVEEVSRLRGLKNPWAAYDDPAVEQEFLPAWLDALGAGLDEQQTDTIKRQVREWAAAPEDPTEKPARTHLERTARSLREDIEFEALLEQLLRPDQYGRYLESVGDDPYFSMGQIKRTTIASRDGDLASGVAEELARTFQLSEAVRPGVVDVATRFVEAVRATPFPPRTLEPAARRRASIERAATLLDLQRKAELELSQDTRLSAEERKRLLAGSQAIIDLELASIR